MVKKEKENKDDEEDEHAEVGVICAYPEDMTDLKKVKDIVQSIRATLKERGNVLMTRLSDEDLEKIDALVEVELFKSRSEAVAYFIQEGMRARKDIFDKVKPTVEKIHALKDEARKALEKKE